MPTLDPTVAEVPMATPVWAHPTNFRVANRVTYNRVVVHVTDGHGNALPVAQMWQEPDHKSSAHLVVGQAGETYQCVRLKDVAWHAHTANWDSIGVEHCARTPGELSKTDPGLPPSPSLYAASAKLVAYLLKAAGLKAVRGVTVVGHAECDPDTTHEDCPNGAFDWGAYWPLLEKEMAA